MIDAMTAIVSSIEDSASAFYRGRAFASSFADNVRMMDDKWKERLGAAIKGSGKSMREISLAAGRGPGYISSILSENKDPTIEHLMAVCDAVPVSLAHILYGFEITPEDADLLAAMKRSPETRQAVLTLIRTAPREPSAQS